MSSRDDVLPFETSSSKPVTSDTTALLNSSNSEAEPVQKSSIRILDDRSREEDLEYGPLLLKIGDSFALEAVPDYQLPITPELDIEPDTYPEELINPTAPNYRAAQCPALSTLSELRPFPRPEDTQTLSDLTTGRSLSLPTESTRSLYLRGSDNILLQGIQNLSISQLHDTIPEELELETADDSLTNQVPQLEEMIPRPWRSQFEWVDGHLLFAGEQFIIHRPFSPAFSSRCAVDTENRTAAPTSYLSNVEHDVYLSGLKSELLNEMIVGLIEKLESRYWTIHGPHRSNQQGQQNRSQGQQANHAPYSINKGSRSNPSRKPSHGRRTMNNSGSGGDEDDGSGSDGQSPTEQGATTRHRRFACPFSRRQPQFSDKNCTASFERISNVRHHLKSDHHPDYCPRCLQSFYDEASKAQHTICKRRKKTRKLPFMTKEQYVAIGKRADKTISHKQQWENIFRILFPDEPLPEHPYQEDVIAERHSHIERFMYKEISPELEQGISQMPPQFKPTSKEMKKALKDMVKRSNKSMLRKYYHREEKPVEVAISEPEGVSLSSASLQDKDGTTEVEVPSAGATSPSVHLEQTFQLGSTLGSLGEASTPGQSLSDGIGAASYNKSSGYQSFLTQEIVSQPGCPRISTSQSEDGLHYTDQNYSHLSSRTDGLQNSSNGYQYPMMQQIGGHPGAYYHQDAIIKPETILHVPDPLWDYSAAASENIHHGDQYSLMHYNIQNPGAYFHNSGVQSGPILHRPNQLDSFWSHPQNGLQTIYSGVECLPTNQTDVQPGPYPQNYSIYSGDIQFGTYENEPPGAALIPPGVPSVQSQSTALFCGQTLSQSDTWSLPHISRADLPSSAPPTILSEKLNGIQ